MKHAVSRNNEMLTSASISGIDGVSDPKAFIASLLSLYAPVDATLTTWDKLPSGVQEILLAFRDPSSWLGLLFFHEGNWYRSNDRVGSLIDSLCANHMIDTFRWVLRKGNPSLGLCRRWDDMNVDGSDLIDDAALFKPICVASSWNA